MAGSLINTPLVRHIGHCEKDGIYKLAVICFKLKRGKHVWGMGFESKRSSPHNYCKYFTENNLVYAFVACL